VIVSWRVCQCAARGPGPSRDFASSGFIFTVTEPQAAHISKARINELLGYSVRNNWVANRLLGEEDSKLLASEVHLTI